MDLLKQLLGLGDNVKNFVGNAVHNVENSIGQGVQNVENFAQPAIKNTQNFIQSIPQDFSHIQVPHIQVPQIQAPKIDVGSYLQHNVVQPVERTLPTIQTFFQNSLSKPTTTTQQPLSIQELFKPVQKAIAPYEIKAGDFLNSIDLTKDNPDYFKNITPQNELQKVLIDAYEGLKGFQDPNKAAANFVLQSVTQPIGWLLKRSGEGMLGQGSVGDKVNDVVSVASVIPFVGKLRELTPAIEPAVKLLQNKLTREDVRLIGTFAEMVDKNPRQDMGEIGNTIHSLAKNVFGSDAVNWNNTKLKNVFDVVLQKVGQNPNKAGLGLSLGDIRQGASNIAQGAQDFLQANPTINTPEIIQAAQDLAKADGRPQVAISDLQQAAKSLGKDITQVAQDASNSIPSTLFRGGRDMGNTRILKQADQKSGAIFFTPTEKYAGQYSKAADVKSGIYKYTLQPGEKIFDITNSQDVKQFIDGAKNWQGYDNPASAIADAKQMIEHMQQATQNGAVDWATASQFIDNMAQSGFSGAKFLERPAENITQLADGSYKLSGKPVYSFAMFNDKLPVEKAYPASLAQTTQPAATEIAKVADNLQRNNPGLGRTEAEAIAQDVIKNRTFSNAATSANSLEQGTNAVAAQANPAEPVAQALPAEAQTAPLPNEQQTPSLPQDTRNILTGQATKDKTLVSRMQQSDKFAPELQQALNGTYIPQSNADTISVAKKLVATDPVAAETRAMNPQNAVDQAIGAELFNHYMSAGNVSKANEILNATSGTNEGQMIQILSQYDKTSPTGAVKFAQSQVDAYNKLHPEKPLTITNDQVQAIFNKATEIQKMPMGRERNIAANELMNQVNALIPSSFTDKLVTVWKAGLLTSLRTHERNIVGNTIHQVAEIAKDPFASVADMIMASKTGKRTMTTTVNDLISGAKQGAQAATDIITKGYDPEQAISKFDVKQINWGNSMVGKAFKAYTETVFRTLGAEDKPFWHAAYARSLYDQAGAAAINAGKQGDKAFIESLVKNPTENMLTLATKDANVATFHNANGFSKVASAVKREMSKVPGGSALAEVVAPFTGVPSSIAGQIVAYSPVGLLKGIANAGKVLIASKEIPNLQRQAAQEIGRGVIGSGLVAIGAYLASKGLMTGQPKDANEAAQWKLEGKTPNSIFIGGQWRSIGSIGPENLVLLAGAKAQEELAKGKDGSIGTYAGNLGKDFLGQTFLQGVQGPLNAVNDPARYGQSYVSGQAASLVPNIIKDIAKAGDNVQRDTKTSGLISTVENSLKSGIPGARETLPPQRDALGNPIPNDQQGINAFIDLFNSSTPRSSVVIDELSRLNSVGNNATPSKMAANQTILGQKVKLTPEVLNQMQGGMAQELQNNLQTLITGPDYQNLTDEEKTNAIDQVVQKTRAAYKNTPGAVDLANGKTTQNSDTSGSITGVAQNVADYAKAYKFDKYLKPNTETGIAKYKFESDKTKAARDIFNSTGSYSNIPDNIKEQIYTAMGYTKDQVEYDATANESGKVKSQYVLDALGKAQTHNEIIQVLLEGRKQSISGEQLVTNAVLTDAKDGGYITADEEKYLKLVSVDQNGQVTQKGGSGGPTSKQKSEIKALGAALATPPKLSSFVSSSKQMAQPRVKVPQLDVSIPQRPNITFPTVANLIDNSKLAPQVRISGSVQRPGRSASVENTPVKLSQAFFRPRKIA